MVADLTGVEEEAVAGQNLLFGAVGISQSSELIRSTAVDINEPRLEIIRFLRGSGYQGACEPVLLLADLEAEVEETTKRGPQRKSSKQESFSMCARERQS